ncbi:MAG TPA: 1-deoxy-D-xylulose-5-phosphate reductoisomerase [Planctomycetota bacterium]|nr:1-deoxy-D-xylulose-5-phosphate reductoisomerase [Planctomycetota bacterium]
MTTPAPPRRLALFGSTGSIGKNALRVVDDLAGVFEVAVLAAWRSVDALAEQAARLRPAVVAVGDPRLEDDLRRALPRDFRGDVRSGPAALAELALRDDVDCVLNAVTGAAGLPVTLAAVRAGKRLALANKESLVAAGPLVMAEAARSGAEIVPVDSEHSALFQALQAGRRDEVKKLILTGSGGPFRTRPRETFASVTRDEALKHPTWTMGPKITVDSATLMNKALEIVEARWLFDAPADQIDVVIHPQSIVHSMVLFQDGSVVAQMSRPDMRTAIQYALTWPRRLPSPLETYSVPAFANLTFEEPDVRKFPSLRFGRRAAVEGGLAGAVLNAANEKAVELFLEGRIAFPEIFERVERTLDRTPSGVATSLDDVLAADAWARAEAAA